MIQLNVTSIYARNRSGPGFAPYQTATMQLNDALIASCRAGNEAPALNRNGELETMLNLRLKAIDTPFTEPFCALGTSKCSYTTISRSPDNAPYPKTLVGYSCTVG